MTSRPLLSASRWLRRWLLVLLTLTGLGIWQGGHCAGDMSPHQSAHTHASSVHSHDVPAAAAPASAGQRGDEHPGSAADACHELTSTPATVAAVNVAVAPLVTTHLRPNSGAAAPPYSPPARQVALTEIGVCRT
jgi:hypothetical protein